MPVLPDLFDVTFESCHARFDGGQLLIENDLVERRWTLDPQGLLTSTSLLDKLSGTQWSNAPGAQPSTPGGYVEAEDAASITLRRIHTQHPVERPSLVVELTASTDAGTLTHRIQVFPHSTGIVVQLHAQLSGANQTDNIVHEAAPASSTGIETTASASARPSVGVLPNVVECLNVDRLHHTLTFVEFNDRTDDHDNLVFERAHVLHPKEKLLSFSGNVCFLEDRLRQVGLLMLKLAPLPHARPMKNEIDVQLAQDKLLMFGHGADPGGGEGYAHVLIPYSGGRAGRIAAMQQFQRQLRPYVPGRDGLFISNTWGDRSRDARINEPFIHGEIKAGATLGVDVLQIDDGWQKGRTANSADSAGGVWNGFWAADANFWDAHPQRLPHGIPPLVQQARQHGMRFGLWFAPDSSNDSANWRRDADAVLRFHREWQVDYVKIDGVKMHTKANEQNLARFYEAVLTESDGKVVFDHDVTAEIRPSYFAVTHVGNLFVENRYTDWHGYWPHHTLRNLWMLAQYVDPVRLRMEFLNNTRNTDKYPNDPLAPSQYRPAYLFATVMFSSPLGWFETQNLPAAFVEDVAPVVRAWKAHRDDIFAGRIVPIGDAPDGTSWTGFVSVSHDAKHVYLLLFRELNDEPLRELTVPFILPGTLPVERLAGDGSATIEAGRVHCSLPASRSFFFGRALV